MDSKTQSAINNFDDFWPYYLRAHLNPRCRALHYIGTTLSLLCLGLCFVTNSMWWLLVGVILGYGFAWIGHFFVEGNKPAAFKRPLWSLYGDYKMYGLWLAGALDPHLKRAFATPTFYAK